VISDCFGYPIQFSVHILAAQSGRFRLGGVAAEKQLFPDTTPE